MNVSTHHSKGVPALGHPQRVSVVGDLQHRGSVVAAASGFHQPTTMMMVDHGNDSASFSGGFLNLRPGDHNNNKKRPSEEEDGEFNQQPPKPTKLSRSSAIFFAPASSSKKKTVNVSAEENKGPSMIPLAISFDDHHGKTMSSSSSFRAIGMTTTSGFQPLCSPTATAISSDLHNIHLNDNSKMDLEALSAATTAVAAGQEPRLVTPVEMEVETTNDKSGTLLPASNSSISNTNLSMALPNPVPKQTPTPVAAAAPKSAIKSALVKEGSRRKLFGRQASVTFKEEVDVSSPKAIATEGAWSTPNIETKLVQPIPVRPTAKAMNALKNQPVVASPMIAPQDFSSSMDTSTESGCSSSKPRSPGVRSFQGRTRRYSYPAQLKTSPDGIVGLFPPPRTKPLYPSTHSIQSPAEKARSFWDNHSRQYQNAPTKARRNTLAYCGVPEAQNLLERYSSLDHPYHHHQQGVPPRNNNSAFAPYSSSAGNHRL